MTTEKALKMFFRCLCIALAFFVIFLGSTFLFYSVHVLEAPYILLTNPQRLGKNSVLSLSDGMEKKKTVGFIAANVWFSTVKAAVD